MLEVPQMARRRNGSDTWHFCANCSNWPNFGYDTGSGEEGETCKECLAKERAGNCVPASTPSLQTWLVSR